MGRLEEWWGKGVSVLQLAGTCWGSGAEAVCVLGSRGGGVVWDREPCLSHLRWCSPHAVVLVTCVVVFLVLSVTCVDTGAR